jgi:hypothetical protein
MNLVNSLKRTLSLNSLSQDQIDDTPIAFAKTRKAVLRELESSRENGLLIGVYSKALGDGMFLVGVNAIEKDGPTEIIVFETYEQSGTILNRTRLSIDEIKMVCSFNRKYVNPILNRIQIV